MPPEAKAFLKTLWENDKSFLPNERLPFNFTLSQTINFRHFQTERVGRRQFHI